MTDALFLALLAALAAGTALLARLCERLATRSDGR